MGKISIPNLLNNDETDMEMWPSTPHFASSSIEVKDRQAKRINQRTQSRASSNFPNQEYFSKIVFDTFQPTQNNKGPTTYLSTPTVEQKRANVEASNIYMLPAPITNVLHHPNNMDSVEMPNQVQIENPQTNNYSEYIKWNDEQTELLTKIVLSKKRINYNKVLKKINELVKDGDPPRTLVSCRAKCCWIRRNLRTQVNQTSEPLSLMQDSIQTIYDVADIRLCNKWSKEEIDYLTKAVISRKQLDYDKIVVELNRINQFKTKARTRSAIVVKTSAIRTQLGLSYNQ